ncbi:l-fucose:H+ symporter permease [Bacteroides sp. CAG:443]|nr:l-fucose:H+ symporter permease [Bacteroides sp. CAG:443]
MKEKRIPLVEKQYRLPFVLLTSLFFLWGFAHAILDVLNKHFQEILDITKAHSAMVQVTMYMGYFIMAISAGLCIWDILSWLFLLDFLLIGLAIVRELC